MTVVEQESESYVFYTLYLQYTNKMK